MDNNDVLKRLRYALNIPDRKIVEMFASVDYAIGKDELEGIFKAEGEGGYVRCDDSLMEKFLDALVLSRRGKRKEDDAERRPRLSGQRHISNNDILKRLRIALELKDEELIAIMHLAGSEISKSELGALFRKSGHPNYRPCGDQFLRLFLSGLTAKYRG
jgi:uncharacterized protein YehS (DUF1456 family)